MPQPNPQAIKLRVTRQAQRALRAGHPWLWAESILEQSRSGAPGDLGVVFDEGREFLAVGLYDPYSPIRLRVLQARQPARVGPELFAARLSAAVAIRETLLRRGTSGYRVINGESDGFPGLVLDRYADTLVIKLYTAAWVPYLPDLIPLFLAVLPARSLDADVGAMLEGEPGPRVVLRLSRILAEHPEALFGLADGQILAGPPLDGPVIFEENGLLFEADVVRGQKTGFFLDQRDNRRGVEEMSAGREVLNAFSFSGGFSVYAARGGCRSVVSLDISPHALASAVRNFYLNFHIPAVAAARHECVQGDAFEVLAAMPGKRSFDLIVLDPPSFARSAAEVPGALHAYAELTRLAVRLLRRNGVLVAASCSAHVAADDFFAAVQRAVRSAGRSWTEIEQSGHPLDHPAAFPEGQYLKCIYLAIR